MSRRYVAIGILLAIVSLGILLEGIRSRSPLDLVSEALATAAAQGQQSSRWTLSGVERIEIEGVSGDLIVERALGPVLELALRYDVRPEGAFRGELDQQGSTVRVEEHWSGGSSRGDVDWTLSVPASLEPVIVMRSASGDLEASGVNARFRFRTASGNVSLDDMTVVSDSSFDTASGDYILTDLVVENDVEMETASGDIELDGVRAGEGFEISTASGEVTIENSEGVLKGSSASGDVRVYETALDGPSRFRSASGHVIVRLDALRSYDLEASSASGNVRIDTAFGDHFTLILIKRADRGRMTSPFAVTSERTFRRNDRLYIEQTVSRGSGTPEIRLQTASGSSVVRDRS